MGVVLKWILSMLMDTIRKWIFSILSVGPIPSHIAFIMDGNRRYAKKHEFKDVSMGHRIGSKTLFSNLNLCYLLGVKYITIYALSIDNFKRKPEEVESLMDLFREKIEDLLKEDSFVFKLGVKVQIAGDLTRLDHSLRSVARRVMKATSKNSKFGLSICIAYTSTDEITRGVRKACEERLSHDVIRLVDVERNMDLSVFSDPDIIIRTSGETRLSNFMLWQSTRCLLYSPSVEWPEIGGRHLVWAILNFQRMHIYFQEKEKATLKI